MRGLEFLRENGALVAADAGCRRILDCASSMVLARRLGAGSGFHVGRGPHIRGFDHITIGRDFRAGPFLRLEAVVEHMGLRFAPQIIIGDGVSISRFGHIAAIELVEIEDGVMMGSSVHITDHAHGCYSGTPASDPGLRPRMRPLSSGGAVRIGRNTWIGEMVNVLPGVVIGPGCVIGAGAVVSRDIPAYTMAVGIPARPIKRYDTSAQAWVPIDQVRTEP